MERKKKRTKRNYARFNSLSQPVVPPMGFWRWWTQTILSGLIFGGLLFILVNFYVFSSIISIDSFLLVFLILTGLTDGLFLTVHLFRKPGKVVPVSCDPSKVSVIISCYNGADVIGETIEHLKRQLPAGQIIVIDDTSSDNTAEVARRHGARVIRNKKNLNKAFSVGVGAHAVTTPYALVMDDDVLIGNAIIPTSLLDDGYAAAAFTVLPIATDTFVNVLQRFEYRNSMYIGKNLRAPVNAIGNISGAIGLYRTRDLQEQAYLHTGQFSGEDEQRTLLAHLYSEGRGIAFANQAVYTHVPNTFHSLYRQRTYGWGIAVPELLILYLRVLFSPRFHYLLKAEKAYYIYIYLTDPLRLLFLWTLFLRPRYLGLTYVAYLVMNTLVWFKTGRKDPYLAVLVYPVYTLWLSLCRFIGNFYWLKAKAVYFGKRYHKLVERRRVVAEFGLIASAFMAAWLVSGLHFMGDMSLFNKIRSSRLEATTQTFNYDSETNQRVSGIGNLGLNLTATPPDSGTYTAVAFESGDTLRALAYKAVDRYVDGHPGFQVPYAERTGADQVVSNAMQAADLYYDYNTSSLLIPNSVLDSALAPLEKAQP